MKDAGGITPGLRRFLFQPPEEVLERKDSLDQTPEKSPIVKAVQVGLTATVAFGAFAPQIATIVDVSPMSIVDVFERGSKRGR